MVAILIANQLPNTKITACFAKFIGGRTIAANAFALGVLR